MRDAECAAFLRWCLPRLELRWQGFRRVRHTLCKRIGRRRRELGLPDVPSYRAHLEQHDEEWRHLDRLCRVPISRFCRDPEVFECLARDVLPDLAAQARRRPHEVVTCWSAGCASGEEPYSLRLAWARHAGTAFPDVGIQIVASDVDATMLARARAGIYRSSSLRDVPTSWQACAFEPVGDRYRIRASVRDGIRFVRQDLRTGAPPGPFDLILCRNLAFTYFQPALQRAVLSRLIGRLHESGYLVIGAKERLPDVDGGLVPAFDGLPIYRRDGRGPT